MRTMTFAVAMMLGLAAPLAAQQAPPQAAATRGSPDERAGAMVAAMTLDEKLTLLQGYFGENFPPARFEAPPQARPGSAGYVPGVPRLGIPPQWQTDAGIGVATQGFATVKRARTALPSGLGVAASWDPQIALAGGAMIGSEARADGFNVMLAGGVNLLREPRNGRNFEYGGEDPLLAGSIVGAAIAGIQSNDVIATTKHYALNDQETDRGAGNAVIAEDAMRMSDLLAFEIAIERGNPGSVMCAYNRVNGPWACESPFLLNRVLRDDWQWPGYVMTDWGAGHSTAASVHAGLDQESGSGLQRDNWFAVDKLKAALAAGEIGAEQIDLMAARVLRAMFAHGLVDNPVSAGQPIDFAANRAISQRAAEAGIVLLKNDGALLPLGANARIAVIGGHADMGVISGGGSSQVYPEGDNAVPGIAPTSWPGPVVYYPSSPLDELRRLLPWATVTFSDGADHEEAVRAAAAADIAVVFATQWATESIDVPLRLDGEQDALIDAVALANRRTAVVLETGGPVLMPWAARVPAIIEAWYPGRMGGAAIARVLTGAVNPSGHLPATFPASLDQMPYPGEPRSGEFAYPEGAAVGYRWFDAQGHAPLYAFGHGLSYTTFAHRLISVAPAGDGLIAEVEVANTGARAGADVAQVYVSGPGGWEAPRRLGGFAKIELAPGERQTVRIFVDPRLLSLWHDDNPGWTRAAGTYTVAVGASSRELGEGRAIELPAQHLAPTWKPAR